jgi:pimeloyl-ACP methyl ester carboxylesterase
MAKTIKQAKISTAIHYTHDFVVVECFHLSSLAKQYALANSTSLDGFHEQTGLADLYWQALYYRFPGQKKTLFQALAEADGFLFFMHGWDGSHRIWEDLPLRLTAKHRNIVCFNLDVNGFGLSPFRQETPSAEQCTPAALMSAVEYWLRAVDLWPTPYREQKPFYLFVGHSMSGAATFYKDVSRWQNEAYGFYALAPALFCNDVQRQAFYKTVGLGIRLPSFTTVKDALAPHMIDVLGTGASPVVKNEHLRVYNQTPFGTIAQTLYVLGMATEPPDRADWSRFRIALGHRDRVVGLNHMLDLLEELNFPPDQIRISLGDHYFFSYGSGSPPSHKRNRRMILDDLLELCYRLGEEASVKYKARAKQAVLSPNPGGNIRF